MKPTGRTKEIDKSTAIAGDFNTPLSVTCKADQTKGKAIEGLNTLSTNLA